MPEVPPQERDPESEQPAEGPASASPQEAPRDENLPLDAVLTPSSGAFGRRDEEQRETRSTPDGTRHEPVVGAEEDQPYWTKPPEETLTEGTAPDDDVSRDSPAPEAATPSYESIPISQTRFPYYPPPVAPEMAGGPGAGVGMGDTGAAEGAVAAPPARRRSAARSFGGVLREVAETVILALLIFLLVRAVVQNFQVEGRSMESTLQNGWYLLVNKAMYWEINLKTVNKFLPFIEPGDDPTRYVFRGPRRGDVIVFKAPNQSAASPERDYIKRVIAVSGETVEVRDGIVYVDGSPLDEPYIERPGGSNYGPETVPPGHYFVLGDNRANSSDSRTFGFLPKENIIGQAWLTYWPFSSFGLVDNTSVEPGASLPEEPSQDEPAQEGDAGIPAVASP